MQTCPGFKKKSLLEYPGNLLEICSVKSVDTLNYFDLLFCIVYCIYWKISSYGIKRVVLYTEVKQISGLALTKVYYPLQ